MGRCLYLPIFNKVYHEFPPPAETEPTALGCRASPAIFLLNSGIPTAASLPGCWPLRPSRHRELTVF